MSRPINYRTKSLKELLEAYEFESDRFESNRINKEDAEVTKAYVVNEVYARVKDTLDLLEKGKDVKSIYE